MNRKTIEYKGEFKVNLGFAMTSGEGVDDAIVEEVVKMMSNEMHEDIKDALEYHFGDVDDVVQHLEIKCEEIDHVINVIDNSSEPETIQEDDTTESGEV
jgi:hypothetical protein